MPENMLLTVNGRQRKVKSNSDVPLLFVLRNDLELNGPKFGCGLGQCGFCTVLLDGAPVRSCITPVSEAQGAIQKILLGRKRGSEAGQQPKSEDHGISDISPHRVIIVPFSEVKLPGEIVGETPKLSGIGWYRSYSVEILPGLD